DRSQMDAPRASAETASAEATRAEERLQPANRAERARDMQVFRGKTPVFRQKENLHVPRWLRVWQTEAGKLEHARARCPLGRTSPRYRTILVRPCVARPRRREWGRLDHVAGDRHRCPRTRTT